MPAKKQKPKKKSVTWRCPACSVVVEHGENVVSHSHSCDGSTVDLERVE